MKNLDMDEHLAEIRRMPGPSVPSGFQAGVFRYIRDREGRRSDFGSWLDGLVPRIAFAVPMVALAIAVGAGMAAWLQTEPVTDRAVLAQDALHFESLTRISFFSMED